MNITRLKVPLEQVEYSALLKISGDELRNPIDQARFILRQEFERRGLLPQEQTPELNSNQAKVSQL
jgi:hypothetical protein